jgi:hypothetical protein
MKKRNFSLATACIALAFAACNNSSETTSSADSTTTNATTSTSDYSAMADTVERNSQSGYYLNPKTGKPLHLKVDRTTGKISDDAGQPITRYVDNRTWWVYGGDRWDTIGSARMQGDNLLYRDESGNWVEYDKRWSDDESMNTMSDSSNMQSSGDNNTKVRDNGNKVKDDNTKVKVADDGNKVKVKKEKGN